MYVSMSVCKWLSLWVYVIVSGNVLCVSLRQVLKSQVDDTEDSDEEWTPRQQGEGPEGFRGVFKKPAWA